MADPVLIWIRLNIVRRQKKTPRTLMITESTCRDVVRCLLNNTTHVGAAAQAHSLPNHDLYRHLLSKYPLGLIDDTLRWLELSGYLGRSGVGLMMTAGLWAYSLTEKGHNYDCIGKLAGCRHEAAI